MICERCGWHHIENHQPEIQGWPEDLPPPPPIPPTMNPHPVGSCCSPFAVDDQVYWDLSGADLDLPPLRASFRELVGIGGPNYHLEGNEWILDGEPKPTAAEICVESDSILPEHHRLFGDMLKKPFDVGIDHLTALNKWPVLA